MFGKIKELTRKVKEIGSHCERLDRKYSQCLKDYVDLAYNLRVVCRQLNCHDCARYPAEGHLQEMMCKVCEEDNYSLKLDIKPKSTCLDDMDVFRKD